jgi:hypothetical protein
MTKLPAIALALTIAVCGASVALAKGSGGSHHHAQDITVTKQTNTASPKMMQSTQGVRHTRPGRQKSGKLN